MLGCSVYKNSFRERSYRYTAIQLILKYPTVYEMENSLPENFKYLILISKLIYTVELQWFEHLWDREIMFETGGVRANKC